MLEYFRKLWDISAHGYDPKKRDGFYHGFLPLRFGNNSRSFIQSWHTCK